MRSTEVVRRGHRAPARMAAGDDSGSPRHDRCIAPAAGATSSRLILPGRTASPNAPADGAPSPTRRRLLQGLSATLALGSLGAGAALLPGPARAEEGDDTE